MNYQSGYVYHIKDEYFLKANDKNLMINKENGQYRPTYYCKKDNNTGLIWVVPMSSQYEKFENEVNKKVEKYGKCNTIVLGSFDNKKAAFLIQNMFPITEYYIDHIHTKNGQPVPVTYKLQNRVKKCVNEVIALTKRGYKTTFTDIKRLETLMLSELAASQHLPLSKKIKAAQQVAQKQNASINKSKSKNQNKGQDR